MFATDAENTRYSFYGNWGVCQNCGDGYIFNRLNNIEPTYKNYNDCGPSASYSESEYNFYAQEYEFYDKYY